MGNRKYRNYLMMLMLAAVVFCGCGKKEEQPETPEAETEVVEEEAEEEENLLEENSHKSIDRLIEKYCISIAEGDLETLESIVDEIPEEEREKIKSRSVIIEAFENIECYTKDGPVEDSYIVFLCYDMKLINIKTPAPDIDCLYISPKDENGARYVHYGNIDENIQAYVTELEKDPEVQALYEDVRTRYQEALESDEALIEFINRITGKVEEPEEEPEEETQEEVPEEEEESSEAEGTSQNRETRVTDSVNIRKEPSTDAERLALAYKGDKITQIESYDDGWSKVEYKGLTGYTKTEFLE